MYCGKAVAFVGYRTLDKTDDIILGIRTDFDAYGYENPLNKSFIGNKMRDASAMLEAIGDGEETALLEELNFFGKGVKLNLSGRKEYVESQDGEPPVLMLGVVATGKEIRYMEAAYPEIKLFEAVEKVR